MDAPNPLPLSLAGKGHYGATGDGGEAEEPSPQPPSLAGKGRQAEMGGEGQAPRHHSHPHSLAGKGQQGSQGDSPFLSGEGGPWVRHAEYPHDVLWDALRDVSDPEMGISLVDMGLVVAARLAGEVAHVTLTYTAMGCPGMQMIENDVRERLLRLPGVREVEIETVWAPVWTKARLTERGRDELLLSGLAL